MKKDRTSLDYKMIHRTLNKNLKGLSLSVIEVLWQLGKNNTVEAQQL